MADVNWKKYDCSICLMLGLLAAAVAAGIVASVLMQTGMSAVWLALLTIVIAAVLFWLVDGYCAGRARAAQHAQVGAGAGVGGVSAGANAHTDSAEAAAAAKAAEEAAAAEAAEEAAAAEAAEEAAAAEAAAVEAKAAEDAAAAEAAAAEAKAAEEAAAAEAAAAEAKAAEEAAAADAETTDGGNQDYDGDGVIEGADEGTRPAALEGPRGGTADDLKRIKGIGPKLEKLCNSLGFYHFDQIAAWTKDEIAWVDANLEGFRGRVSRDEWVSQAETLAAGGETDFSKRVDGGDVPSSQ